MWRYVSDKGCNPYPQYAPINVGIRLNGWLAQCKLLIRVENDVSSVIGLCEEMNG